MADLVEISSQGWLSRIFSSIGGVLVGLLLFFVAFPLLWWNEGRAVQTYKSLKEGAGVVVPAAAERVDAAHEGKLVHVSGRATTAEILEDPTFKISAAALRLRREVEMYQWVQNKSTEKRKKLGGSEETVTSYSYALEWRPGLVDSSLFKQPEGHRNPASMRYESAHWSANTVTLGAFTLGPGLRDKITTYVPVPASGAALPGIDGAAAPANLAQALAPAARPTHKKGKHKAKARPLAAAAVQAPASPWKASGEGLYFGADPGSPAVGDLRVSFSKVAPTDVSLIARQTGKTFGPYQTDAGNALEMLTEGTVAPPRCSRRPSARTP